MRVLFTSIPAWGHVHPMVPLAQALRDSGHELLWVTAGEPRERLEAEGFDTATAGWPIAEVRARVAADFPEIFEAPPTEFPDLYFPKVFGATAAPVLLPDLLPLAREFRPDLIVADAADFAAPLVGALLGVPCVNHGFGSLLPRKRVEAAAGECAHLWREHGLEPRAFGGCYDHLYIDLYPPSLGAAAADYLGAVQPLRPGVFATGEAAPLPDELTDDGPPLVYATLGTVFNDDAALFVAMAQAIAAAGARGVLTVGPQGDPAAVGEVPAGVHVARYVRQDQVLPHCAAVMSHAGSGTFLAGLGLGIPQVCIPLAADQFLNAAAAARANVAAVVPPDDRSVERLSAALAQVLDDDVMRKSAEAVRADIEAMPGPAEVAEALVSRFG